ncbi:MAG: T9SS type A sorting domain-containing protein, partial [Bacteroidota bacterium]
TDKTGQKWTKEIKISITPPTTYELLQNYPNPFNPTTTIEYQLPGAGTRYNVSLKVYDVIGREVVNLVNEQQEPGYYQKTFDASRLASGMYVYRLVATDEQKKQHVFNKKMLMLK